MKNKKILFVFVLICIIFLLIFYYIFLSFGNNKNRNQNEFVEDIFEKLEKYEANIDVIVKSNKTENHYNMKQYVDEKYSKVVVNSPENAKDLEMEIFEGNLKVSKMNLSAEKIYKNYKPIINNSLFLNSFIRDCKNNDVEIYEEGDEIIIYININNNENTYIKSKELYLDKKSELPKKMIIKDESQNIYTSIIYNDIKIK